MFSNFLSPIDDYSDLPFRLLCQKYGAAATCYPLANSTAISRETSKSKSIDVHRDEKNVGVQLVGNEPTQITASAKVILDQFPFISWLNLNCGCPSVRTMHCGGGSAMLAHPDKIADAVSSIKRFSPVPFSVKLRISIDFSNTLSICKKIESAGADFIVLHGRTANAGYSGKSNWDLIKRVNSELSVPLVGNGDISSLEQGQKFVKEEYCDSFMVARAAMSNPMVFSKDGSKAPLSKKVNFFFEYVSLHEQYFGIPPQLRDLKLKAINFVNGAPNASEIRKSICLSKSLDEITGTLNSISDKNSV